MLLFWTLLSILVSVLAVRLNLSELESRESHLNLAWSVYFFLIHWWVWNFFFVRLFLMGWQHWRSIPKILWNGTIQVPWLNRVIILRSPLLYSSFFTLPPSPTARLQGSPEELISASHHNGHSGDGDTRPGTHILRRSSPQRARNPLDSTADSIRFNYSRSSPPGEVCSKVVSAVGVVFVWMLIKIIIFGRPRDSGE